MVDEEKEMTFKNFLFGKISRKLFLVFGFMILITLLVGAGCLYSHLQLEKENSQVFVEDLFDHFYNLIGESTNTLAASLEVLVQNEDLKRVYLEKDRDRLYNYTKPLFDKLKEKHGITHFYFILPDGTTFLRMHNKEKYGEMNNRISFAEAQATKEVVVGFELGETAFALRVVRPYYYQEELIGYVEFAQEIPFLLDLMKDGSFSEYFIIVDKRHLNHDSWKSLRDVAGLRDNWDDFNDYVVVENTINNFSKIDKDFWKDNFDLENFQKLNEPTFYQNINLNGSVFQIGGFPVLDTRNHNIGTILFLKDFTLHTFLLSSIRNVFSLVLLVMLFIALVLSFFVARSIGDAVNKLYNATLRLKMGDFGSRVDIKTLDEFQELGEMWNKTISALEKSGEDKKKLEKAKTEFISITSHELRSPMTPMKAQLQMILKGYFGKLNSKQKKSLDIVLRNTQRLDKIIWDFLEISRIEAARLNFNFVKTDLRIFTKRLIEEMRAFMPEKKVKIVSNIGKIPRIETDPDRMMQVLRNLITNAIKFSPNNAIVKVSVKLSRHGILFSVKDKGIGIRSKELRKVFEPFYQAEQTIFRKYGGTGLGLTIAKGIVESQKGKIWVESEWKKGSKFFFLVPLKPVKDIEPIKLLFSPQEDMDAKIKDLFVEFLGPIGAREFVRFNQTKATTKKNILEYIEELHQYGILEEENFEKFKEQVMKQFERVPEKLSSIRLLEEGYLRKGKLAEGLTEEDILRISKRQINLKESDSMNKYKRGEK